MKITNIRTRRLWREMAAATAESGFGLMKFDIDLPLFKDGNVVLTDAPGLGVELKQEICRSYLAPGQEYLA